jgi:hypothetical protein
MIGTNYRHILILIILVFWWSIFKVETRADGLGMLVDWLMTWKRTTRGVLSCDLDSQGCRLVSFFLHLGLLIAYVHAYTY